MGDILIFSDNPSVIEWQVVDMIRSGYNLSGAPFVMADNFCQWVTPIETANEYKLVSAVLPSEMEQEVNGLAADGFIRVFAPVDWNGKTFQWMSRYNPAQARAAGADDAVVVAGVPNLILGNVSFSSSYAILPRSQK